MTKKLKAELLVISAALAMSVMVLGLSAFLTDSTDAMPIQFVTAEGKSFGISVDAPGFDDSEDAVLLPNSEAVLDPTVSNDGSFDAYVFLEVSIPTDDSGEPLYLLGDIDTESWTQITEAPEAVDGTITTVYGYGTEEELIPLAPEGSTSALFPGIQLTNVESAPAIQIVAHAIQSTALVSDGTIDGVNNPVAITPADGWAAFGQATST